MNSLNLEFSGNSLRILQLSSAKEIISKDEVNLSFNLNDDLYLKKNKDELISEFSEHINSILNNAASEARTSGVLIGTEQTFLSIFPIDFNEDQNSINSHILWELSNYYPENYKDFNIKYYRLNNNYFNKNIDEALLIAVNNKLIEFIKHLCNGSNIKIKNLEIDQFAIEKCLVENHPEAITDKTILIIGCKSNRMDFSLLVNRFLKYYDFEIKEGNNFKNSIIKQMNIYNSGFNNHNIEEIFLYGDKSIIQVKDFLNELQSNIKVSFIKYSEKNEDTAFSALYGLALKSQL